MKFVFKMLVLVGMILVGRFLKEDATNEVVGNEKEITAEDSYSLNNQKSYPTTPQTKNIVVPTAKKQHTGETFTYSFN